jgi:hypothetical protein
MGTPGRPDATRSATLCHEHKEIGLFGENEVAGLNMPDGYKRSISTWFAWLHENQVEPTG